MEKFDNKIENNKELIPQALEKIAYQARNEVVREFPSDTGKTAADFQVYSSSDLEFKVTNPNPAALYVYTGRGEVTPVNGKALHFFINGQEVFAKRVEGTEPNDYITPALESVSSQVDSIAQEVFRDG